MDQNKRMTEWDAIKAAGQSIKYCATIIYLRMKVRIMRLRNRVRDDFRAWLHDSNYE